MKQNNSGALTESDLARFDDLINSAKRDELVCVSTLDRKGDRQIAVAKIDQDDEDFLLTPIAILTNGEDLINPNLVHDGTGPIEEAKKNIQ